MAGLLEQFSKGLFGLAPTPAPNGVFSQALDSAAQWGRGVQDRGSTLATLLRDPLPEQGRATLLPFRDTPQGREFATPGILASLLNAATAPARSMQGGWTADEDGNLRPSFDAPAEAQNAAMGMMGGGGIVSRGAPAGGLGMFKTAVGRLPENSTDTNLLANMIERAGQNAGYSVLRDGSKISPSQYITFSKAGDAEDVVRQLRISNHADKYPELASGVRTSIDPSTGITFEQGVNWLKNEGFPTSLSTRYKDVPSWEQKYIQDAAMRDLPEKKLEALISAWRNKPKSTRGEQPTLDDAIREINKWKK